MDRSRDPGRPASSKANPFGDFLFSMFTGIIQNIGEVRSLQPFGDSLRLSIDTGQLATELKIGDSIAIDGVCLTVEKIDGASAEFFASPETLQRTTLGDFSTKQKVNLELPLKAGQNFGGHFVQGHVDSIATIAQIRDDGEGAWTFRFKYDPAIRDLLINKGSVAVDGISLTIAAINDSKFQVAIIPHTFNNTCLQFKKAGQRVNIETDMIARQVNQYIQRYPSVLQPREMNHSNITEELLTKAGFME